MRTWLQRLGLLDVLNTYTEEHLYNNGRICNIHFGSDAFSSTLKTYQNYRESIRTIGYSGGFLQENNKRCLMSTIRTIKLEKTGRSQVASLL